MDAKMLGVLAVIALGVLGYFFLPGLMGNVAASSAFKKLVALHAQVTEDEGSPAQPAKTKDWLKQLEEIVKPLKGAKSGTSQREVNRMGTNLKDMINNIGKPLAPGSPADAMTDYQAAKKRYEDAMKLAMKRLGLK
jgi:hypothetical protein